MLELLEQLVLQSSHTADLAGTSAAAELLARALAAIAGMTVERIQSEDYGTHILAFNQAASDSARGCVALLGHHATVFPQDSFEGFALEGHIARGPGVLDMKSGLVIVVFALRALAAAGALERVPIRVLSVSDEEIGSPEGAGLIEKHLGEAGCSLVFEAGRKADAIITARKGTGKILATAKGRAAHAGNRHAEGANAIVAMARLIEATQALTDYGRGVTINAGIIHGGQGRNVVPDHCEALFDMRFVSMADGKWIEEQFAQAAKQAAASIAGCTIELQGGVARPPLERCDGNVALFEQYASCAKAAGLGHEEADLVGGGSDASTIAALGVPAIDGLGPRGTGFHTNDELIEVPTLVPRLEALARFLVRR